MGPLLSFITMLLPILPSLSLMLQVTRYPTVNKKLVLPIQVAGLIDSDNPQMVRKTSLSSSDSHYLPDFTIRCDQLWV